MPWYEDVEEIREDIAELRAALEAGPGLPAEARVTALAALVNARALVLAVETFERRREGVAVDVIGPLTYALARFPEAANELAAGLRRLPDR
jgi:hypothetical protein